MVENLLKQFQHAKLNQEQISEICEKLFSPDFSDIKKAAFLYGLSVRGETEDEIFGFANYLLSKAKLIHAPKGTIDLCGTGGDGLNYLNISSAAAIIVASGDVYVAKHGNKSVSSNSGSSDIYAQLGVNINISPDQAEKILSKTNFVYLAAPIYHNIIKDIASVRAALGVRTIFNLLGPILSPARVKTQIIGVYDKKYAIAMLKSLQRLGSKRVMIVHSAEGADEISLVKDNYIYELKDNKISEYKLSANDFALNNVKQNDLIGKDPNYNKEKLLDLLDGKKSAYRDIVIANSATAFYIAGKVENLVDGVKLASLLIDSGKAKAKLNELIYCTNNV